MREGGYADAVRWSMRQMPGWEYCAVMGVFNSYQNRHLAPKYPAIWYFTPEGVRIEEIKGRDPQQVTRTIARLGLEGWEMVGCGNLEVAEHAIYFKRSGVQGAMDAPQSNGHREAEEVPDPLKA